MRGEVSCNMGGAVSCQKKMGLRVSNDAILCVQRGQDIRVERERGEKMREAKDP